MIVAPGPARAGQPGTRHRNRLTGVLSLLKQSSLAARGYHVLDVREAPDRPGREFVFIARRAT